METSIFRFALWESIYEVFNTAPTEGELDDLLSNLDRRGLCLVPMAAIDPKKSDHQFDKLFITEVLNDLWRNGFVVGGKAETMLKDWSRELKEKSRGKHPASRLKKAFAAIVGIENW